MAEHEPTPMVYSHRSNSKHAHNTRQIRQSQATADYLSRQEEVRSNHELD